MMYELNALQQKMMTLDEETAFYKAKISKLEREENSLDNLVIKTQKSNSELLDGHKAMQEELRVQKNIIKGLELQLESKSTEKIECEKKLGATEQQLEVLTDKLTEENQGLIHELTNSKRMIGEFEGILDQGQLDYDEMETQLERYRQENIEFDTKLHEALKQEIKSQSERDQLEKTIEHLNEDYIVQKDKLDRITKEHEKCIREREDVDMKFQECKSREEYFEETFERI